MYKVVITASGTGSRLGQLTQNCNKALVPIAGQPALEYILNSYDQSVPLVFTVGYLAEQVMDYVREKCQDRSFEFVKIDPYQGPGSSLGYSLGQAKTKLLCPFIFHACDTIVTEKIPAPTFNWVASCELPTGTDISSYRTHQLGQKKRCLKLNDKGEVSDTPIHIGLTGIFDYRAFWSTLERLYKAGGVDNCSLSEAHVVAAMINSGTRFASLPFQSWLDTGNSEALAKTRQRLTSSRAEADYLDVTTP